MPWKNWHLTQRSLKLLQDADSQMKFYEAVNRNWQKRVLCSTWRQHLLFNKYWHLECIYNGILFNRDVTKTGNRERGAGNGERKSGNEFSAETSTKIQNGGPKNETEKVEDKERNLCLGWNQVGTKLQIRLTFSVYVLSRWYVFSIFNLFHLQYDKVLGLSFRDTWHTHITPGLLRLL